MPASSLNLPAWFQWTLGILTILWALGGALFALFVLWPSIRKSNKVADKILAGPELKGKPATLNDLVDSVEGDPFQKDHGVRQDL